MKSIVLLALFSTAAIAAEDYGKGTVIFARGTSLFRVDPTGKGEKLVATFTTKAPVRALRTDNGGRVLLVDIGGTWGWMPLDGSTQTIVTTGCAAGPAQLAEDGTQVVCADQTAGKTRIITLATNTAQILDVPVDGARLIGTGADKKLVWVDKSGVWIAPPRELAKKKLVGPEAPLRHFAASPDGGRAVGVWADQIYATVRVKKPAEILMGVQLDGIAARRRAIKGAIPLEWSHDANWILVQDGASACVMGATGGQYKCWRGYTAASIAPDGRFTLVLGNRDGSKQKPPTATPKPKPSEDAEDDDAEVADIAVPLPTGPLALYRARLEGPFTEAPILIVKIVDGAAVWVPPTP